MSILLACTICMQYLQRPEKRMSGPLELELQTFVSHQVGGRKPTWGLCKRGGCSYC